MDKPSEAWKNFLHDNKSLDNAAKESYELYLKKYAKDSTEFPRAENFTDRFFISGKIYSFLYTTDEKPNKDRPVIDRRPIVLSFGQIVNEADNNVYETGIDLMLVPPKIRIFILDRVFEIFKKQITENEKDQVDGRKGKRSIGLDYRKAKVILDKSGWQSAYCAFDKRNISKPVVYDYADWATLVPLDTKALQGKQLKEVFDSYVRKMNAKADVEVSKLFKK